MIDRLFLYLFISALVFTLSCSREDTGAKIFTLADFTKATDSLSADRMGYELKYIPLEMNDSSVISAVQKMEAAGEYIFI